MKFVTKLMTFLDHLLCSKHDTLDAWYLLMFTTVSLSLSVVLISYFILWYEISEKLNSIQVCLAITWFYTHVLATSVYVFSTIFCSSFHAHTQPQCLGGVILIDGLLQNLRKQTSVLKLLNLQICIDEYKLR